MAYFIIHRNCTACNDCLQVCMNGAIVDLMNELRINPAWCAESGSCAAMCYENAILFEGLETEEDYFLQENTKDLTGQLLAYLVY